MRYKLCKFRENHARDTPLWGTYIPNFGKISVKIVVGPMPLSLQVKFFHGIEIGPLNFTPNGATCRSCWAKTLKIGL